MLSTGQLRSAEHPPLPFLNLSHNNNNNIFTKNNTHKVVMVSVMVSRIRGRMLIFNSASQEGPQVGRRRRQVELEEGAARGKNASFEFRVKSWDQC